MNFNKRLHLLAMLIFAVIGPTMSDLYAQGQEGDAFSKSPLHREVLELAIKCRYAPLTRVSFPVMVKGLSLMRLTQDQFIFSYISLQSEEKTFYVQALITTKGEAKFYDATFLSFQESAKEFYEANHKYFIAVGSVEYALALKPGMEFTLSNRIKINDGPVQWIYESHDRAFAHLCGWIRYFGVCTETAETGKQFKNMSEEEREKLLAEMHKRFHSEGAFEDLSKDERTRLVRRYSQQVAEFLIFVLEKENSIFAQLISEEDFDNLESKIKLFDGYFPFGIFDSPIKLSQKQKTQCKKFFETSLYARKRLKVFNPEFADTIRRDEEIIDALSE